MYVFVCLNEPLEPPAYFIATAEETRAKFKQYSVRGIIDLTSLRSDIEAALGPPDRRTRRKENGSGYQGVAADAARR
jgi:hypothetical protein